jgi:hypothetical protein
MHRQEHRAVEAGGCAQTAAFDEDGDMKDRAAAPPACERYAPDGSHRDFGRTADSGQRRPHDGALAGRIRVSRIRSDRRGVEDVDRFKSKWQAVAGLSVIGGRRCPVAMSG